MLHGQVHNQGIGWSEGDIRTNLWEINWHHVPRGLKSKTILFIWWLDCHIVQCSLKYNNIIIKISCLSSEYSQLQTAVYWIWMHDEILPVLQTIVCWCWVQLHCFDISEWVLWHRSLAGQVCNKSCPQQWSDYDVVTAPPPRCRSTDPRNQRVFLGKKHSGDPQTAHSDLGMGYQKEHNLDFSWK